MLFTVRPQSARDTYYVFSPKTPAGLAGQLTRCCLCCLKMELPQIPSGDIDFDEPRRKLGEGSFGVVYCGEWQGSTVAVKVSAGPTCACARLHTDACMCTGPIYRPSA